MSTELDAMWAEGLEAGELAFPRCSACGAWNWYPLPQCSHCQARETPWVRVEARGWIYSWTLSHHDFVRGGALVEPIVIALVNIAEAPEIRIPCRQRDSGHLPTIGEPVRLEVASYNGRRVWSYVPADGSADRPSDCNGAS